MAPGYSWLRSESSTDMASGMGKGKGRRTHGRGG